MDSLHFFYGTLCHPPLLAEVLGRAVETSPAILAGYTARGALNPQGHALTFPVIVPEPGATVAGVLAQVGPEEAARLDYFEAGYAAGTVTVTRPDGSRAEARAYLPLPDRLAPGPAWEFAPWVAKWGEIATLAAAEFMALMGSVPAEQAAFRYPMILVRAASRIRAQAEAPARLRRQAEPGDVTVDTMTTGYAKFFAVEDYTLRHRTFGGAMTPPLPRAAFVSGDATVLLPYDPLRDRVLLVEQFRPGPFARGAANPWSLEAIAGRVDAGETPAEAALREAGEEAGLSLSRLIAAPNFYPSPGAKTEYLYCFIGIADLADGSARPGGLEEEGEDIRPHLISFSGLMDLIATGEAENGPLLVLALWLARLRPELRAGAGVQDGA